VDHKPVGITAAVKIDLIPKRGNFNAKHPWWGSRLTNPKESELYKCIVNNSITTPSTGKPTYWPTDSRKIPDIIDFVAYLGIAQSQMRIMEVLI